METNANTDNQNGQGAVNTDDNIPSLHDVVFGKDGKIDEVFDRENGKTYKRSAPPSNTQVAQPPVDNSQQSQQAQPPVENGAEEGQQQSGNEVEFLHYADLVVNKIMGNNVEFPQDMSEEEQAEVVAGSFQDVIDHYEGQLNEARKLNALTPHEQEVVQALRDGKKLNEIAPASPFKDLDLNNKDQVVRFMLQNDNPDWTEQEVDDEVNDLKDRNKLDKFYKTYKGKVESIQRQQEEQIANDQRASLENMQKQELAEMQAEIQEVGNIFSSLDEFYGVPVDDEMKTLAFRFSTEINPKSGQTYLQDLLSSPQGLAEVAMLKLFGEHIVEANRQNSFTKGFKENIGRYPDEPIQQTRHNAYIPSKYDLDKLSQVDQIGT